MRNRKGSKRSKVNKQQASRRVKGASSVPKFAIASEPKERPKKLITSGLLPSAFQPAPTKPVFLINTTKEVPVTKKAKLVIKPLSPQEKLDAFLEMTCYEDDHGFAYIDVSHQVVAEDWLYKELTFLTKADHDELKLRWEVAIEDGTMAKMLFNAVKILKSKY